MSPSKILFFLCFSFIAGIFLESLMKIPQVFLWAFLLSDFLLILAFLFLRKDLLVIAGFCFLFLISGVIRAQISEFNIANDKLSKFNDKGQVVLTGIISNEPDVRDTFQKIKVHPVKFAFNDASLEAKQFNWIKISDSTILVTTKRYPEYKYLDTIKLIGNLETPMVADDFNYKNYLMKDHVYSVMDFPKVELISERHRYSIFSYLYDKILFFKEKLRESIQHNFLPPQSSILEGTILGDNGAMTNDLKDKLNITGLRHIIAVSGTHVVILSSIIMSLLLAVGLWRGQAFYIAVIFICIYIVLVGLPPSGIRAAIMGGIYLLSQKVGRQTIGSRLVVLACAIMLLINPLLLIYDIGFQLSFMAVFGLIYLEPFIEKLIKKFTKDKVKNFVTIVAITFAAQIFTLPIMVYNFGNISFVSPITNLLIIPIVYWLMIFGFLASAMGIFSNIIGWILSVPCWFLLTYFVKVIDIFSQPWMGKIITNVSWIWLFISYSVISMAVWFLNKKYSQKFI